MGSCSGKQDVISQNSLVTIETAVDDRKTSNIRHSQLPTCNMIADRNTKEKVDAHLECDSEKENCSNNQTRVSKPTGSNTPCDKTDPDYDNTNEERMHQLSISDFETDEPIESESMSEHLDSSIFNQVFNPNNILGDSEGDWLEVINEADEFELENGDEISLLESEIIEDYINDVNVQKDQYVSNESNGLSNPKEMKKLDQSKSDIKRKDSSNSNKSAKIRNEQKKTDKNKLNNTKKDVLWTSRSKAKWMEEKIYTTKGKDGTLFRIKILRKPTKETSDKGKACLHFLVHVASVVQW